MNQLAGRRYPWEWSAGIRAPWWWDAVDTHAHAFPLLPSTFVDRILRRRAERWLLEGEPVGGVLAWDRELKSKSKSKSKSK